MSDTGRPATITGTTLLEGLRDPGNQAAWQQYVDRYRPVIVSYARGLGFAADEAEDIAQEALLAFSAAYVRGKYERQKGRLSSWLFGIVHVQAMNWRRKRLAHFGPDSPARSTGSSLADLPSEQDLEETWCREWRSAVLRQCLEVVRGEVQQRTYRAFELFALEGRPAEAVGEELGMTPNAVWVAKRRILRRVRALLPLMEDVW